MNRDVFGDHEVAALLNKDFVCVKVDRDEMPEIHAYYMKAAQTLGVKTDGPLTV